MSNRETSTRTAREIQNDIWFVESLVKGAHTPKEVRRIRAKHATLTAELATVTR